MCGHRLVGHLGPGERGVALSHHMSRPTEGTAGIRRMTRGVGPGIAGCHSVPSLPAIQTIGEGALLKMSAEYALPRVSRQFQPRRARGALGTSDRLSDPGFPGKPRTR